jgi:hypothetical protein
LDAFFSHVVVAVPLSEIVAVVYIAAQHQEASTEGLSALEALALLLTVLWTWLILEDL